MKVILLSGWKGSGKDTAADYLVANYGFKRISFAGALKDMVSEQYNVPRNYMDDRDLKEAPLPQYPVVSKDQFASHVNGFMAGEHKSDFHTPRSLCILEGSVKRSVNPGYWIERAFKNVDPNGKYVISDCRFHNEISGVARASGQSPLTVRINRFDSTTSVDPSERDLDNYPFDVVVENKGTVEELQTTLAKIIKE